MGRRFPKMLAVLLLAWALSGCARETVLPEDAAPAPAPETEGPLPELPAEPEDPPEPETLPDPPGDPADFVRVVDYLPDIQVDLRYAGEDNFTGQAIYGFTDAYLRYGTVEKLSQALDTLEDEGYSLLIWDAFRPVEAQFRLWEICPDPVYVANPETGCSSHSRGNTVDLTLISLDGEPVEMPTGFDDFSSLADRDYRDVPEQAAAHARLLEDVMKDCGFTPYQGEWWHFSDSDQYPVEETFVPPSESEES